MHRIGLYFQNVNLILIYTSQLYGYLSTYQKKKKKVIYLVNDGNDLLLMSLDNSFNNFFFLLVNYICTSWVLNH